MEQIGFVFGVSGLAFALIAMEKLSSLRKDFDKMKNDLADSGIIKVNNEASDK